MSEIIYRLNAALEGRYRVERELGEGGMATVFLAEDLKHDRQVAIKVLKPELAAVIGGERFVAEIKTTAALQHPHILPLFDSGAADGFLYYVMPFVEGPSLRAKLDQEKQLGVDEAVDIASAVASALHYAHEQGIVHRDIKPANILIHAGEPVVADFGIALAISAAGGGRLTETGMSVGTPHYMSPEQASADRDVSTRSDIYALACVLYEMLAGEPPHTGSTAQAVLMRILTEEPRDVSDVRKSVPVHVRDALARALEKLPADRFESADEFKRALGDEGFRYRPKTRVVRAAPRGGDRLPWGRDPRILGLLALTGALIVAVALLALGGTGETGAAPTHRYLVEDSLRSDVLLDISARGDVVYEATVDGRTHLRIRRASDLHSSEIPNTDEGTDPTLSPDGEWVAFVADNQLRKVQLSTGTAVTLVPEGTLTYLNFPVWADDGTILFGGPSDVYRVPDVGGEPESLGAPSPVPFNPRILPDGRTLLYTDMPQGDPANGRVVMLDLETGDTVTIADPGGNAAWSSTGHILYGHPSATIFAVPFDLGSREVTGQPVPVQENVFTFGNVSLYALASNGDLAYIQGGGTELNLAEVVLAWLDPEGPLTDLPLSPTDHPDMSISPDGAQIAYTREDDIWVYDVNRGSNRRFTFEGSAHHDPVWSPDGLRLAFTSDRDGRVGDIFVKDVDGRSPAEWRAGREGLEYASQWLEDGLVIFSRTAAGEQTDILWAPADGSADTTGLVALLEADWDETYPRVSPDGRYMAYVSSETGQPHVFVREFPDMAGRWQVSERPGYGPLVWSLGGSALFYHDGETGRVLRADLEFDPAFQVLERNEVTERSGVTIRSMHPDGRILTSRPLGSDAMANPDQGLVVAVNWLTELRRRLGEDR